jgi:hypothetical protein
MCVHVGLCGLLALISCAIYPLCAYPIETLTFPDSTVVDSFRTHVTIPYLHIIPMPLGDEKSVIGGHWHAVMLGVACYAYSTKSCRF